MKIDVLFLLIATRMGRSVKLRRREVGIGKVDLLEGVVALNKEVHIDVGIVVQRLIALNA